jgi:hypothetical protein
MPSVFSPAAPLSTDDADPSAAGGFAGEQEVSILGFGRMVTVYSSKQKPKLLTIYCDDFK